MVLSTLRAVQLSLVVAFLAAGVALLTLLGGVHVVALVHPTGTRPSSQLQVVVAAGAVPYRVPRTGPAALMAVLAVLFLTVLVTVTLGSTVGLFRDVGGQESAGVTLGDPRSVARGTQSVTRLTVMGNVVDEFCSRTTPLASVLGQSLTELTRQTPVIPTLETGPAGRVAVHTGVGRDIQVLTAGTYFETPPTLHPGPVVATLTTVLGTTVETTLAGTVTGQTGRLVQRVLVLLAREVALSGIDVQSQSPCAGLAPVGLPRAGLTGRLTGHTDVEVLVVVEGGRTAGSCLFVQDVRTGQTFHTEGVGPTDTAGGVTYSQTAPVRLQLISQSTGPAVCLQHGGGVASLTVGMTVEVAYLCLELRHSHVSLGGTEDHSGGVLDTDHLGHVVLSGQSGSQPDHVHVVVETVELGDIVRPLHQGVPGILHDYGVSVGDIGVVDVDTVVDGGVGLVHPEEVPPDSHDDLVDEKGSDHDDSRGPDFRQKELPTGLGLAVVDGLEVEAGQDGDTESLPFLHLVVDRGDWPLFQPGTCPIVLVDVLGRTEVVRVEETVDGGLGALHHVEP